MSKKTDDSLGYVIGVLCAILALAIASSGGAGLSAKSACAFFAFIFGAGINRCYAWLLVAYLGLVESLVWIFGNVLVQPDEHAVIVHAFLISLVVFIFVVPFTPAYREFKKSWQKQKKES